MCAVLATHIETPFVLLHTSVSSYMYHMDLVLKHPSGLTHIPVSMYVCHCYSQHSHICNRNLSSFFTVCITLTKKSYACSQSFRGTFCFTILNSTHSQFHSTLHYFPHQSSMFCQNQFHLADFQIAHSHFLANMLKQTDGVLSSHCQL